MGQMRILLRAALAYGSAGNDGNETALLFMPLSCRHSGSRFQRWKRDCSNQSRSGGGPVANRKSLHPGTVKSSNAAARYQRAGITDPTAASALPHPLDLADAQRCQPVRKLFGPARPGRARFSSTKHRGRSCCDLFGSESAQIRSLRRRYRSSAACCCPIDRVRPDATAARTFSHTSAADRIRSAVSGCRRTMAAIRSFGRYAASPCRSSAAGQQTHETITSLSL